MRLAAVPAGPGTWARAYPGITVSCVKQIPLCLGVPLPELSRRRRYPVPANCCLSLFAAGLDGTIVDAAAAPTARYVPESLTGSIGDAVPGPAARAA
jgi:hypothetical protein